ncbi:MAG: FHA domain-containing protein [Ruminococcaceae bacterium]|nr:FHA domain-containing protein [Oscillospiraceae bacterium]
MKKTTKRLALAMVVLTLLQVMFAIPSFAKAADGAADGVVEAREAVVQIYLTYTDEKDVEWYLKAETGFFINSNYILTCDHGVNLTGAEVADLAELYGDLYEDESAAEYFLKNYKNRLGYKIMLDRDVHVYATPTEAKSAAYDFAVLKVNTSLNGIVPLALGNDDMVDVDSDITCLGFPSVTTNWTVGNEFKASDVTLTDGKIGKYETIDGTDYFMHSALIGEGSSGGPTLLDDATVVGMVGAVAVADGRYAYSLLVDEMKGVLDKFGIEYIKRDGGVVTPGDDVCDHEWGSAVMNNCVPTYTCSKCNETKTDAAQHTYGEWTVIKEATAEAAGEKAQMCTVCGDKKTEIIPATGVTTTANADKKDDDKGGLDMMTIILIAAGAVVLIVIVIIIVVLAGGKKKAAPAPAPAQRPMAPPAPMAPQPMAAPMAPRPMAPPMNEGAGETTVLNDGAGETTVLGGGAACGSLIRTKTGERISIVAPEFVIGKEKRRVNYCISDNNSISRAHAKIIVRGGSCYVVDMNSTNFTFVNGTKLASGQEQLLNDGDKIKLSDEEFEFKA